MTIIICCTIALILLTWFRTEAWLEYTKLFHLNFLSFYKDFEDKKSHDVTLTYIMYLRMYHNCFFVRLLTCPICLSAWIGLLIAIFTIPLYAPVYIIGGLIIFTVIDRLLG